jgi:hypothetical protein
MTVNETRFKSLKVHSVDDKEEAEEEEEAK